MTFFWLSCAYCIKKAVDPTVNTRDNKNCLIELLFKNNFSCFWCLNIHGDLLPKVSSSYCFCWMIGIENLSLLFASVELRWNGSSCVNSSWWSSSLLASAPWRCSWLSRAWWAGAAHNSLTVLPAPGGP